MEMPVDRQRAMTRVCSAGPEHLGNGRPATSHECVSALPVLSIWGMEGRPLGKNELRTVQVASRRRRRIWFLKEELRSACWRQRRTLVGGGEPGSGASVTARGSKWRATEEFESAKERKAIDDTYRLTKCCQITRLYLEDDDAVNA